MSPRIEEAVTDRAAPQPLPIYCINLTRSAARRAHMEKEFDRLGWGARFVRAVDGSIEVDPKALLDNNVLAPDNEGACGPMSAAEIGCYLSHERVWRAIRRNREAYALVCEDDIRFHDPIIDLAGLIGTLPADCDIVYLRYTSERVDISPPFEIANSAPAATVGPYGVHHAWSCGGAQCYLLTARGVASLLAASRPIRFPVDGQLGRLGYTRQITVYALHPMATESGWLPSTIA